MASDETIRFRFLPDKGQLADRLIGNEHQNYANYKMIYTSDWDRYLYARLADNSILASIAGAFAYAVGIKLTPGAWLQTSDLWLFAPAPLAALVCWLVMRFAGKWLSRPYHRAFAAWNIEAEQLAGDTRVELGPEGARIANDRADVRLSWWHYHYALLQPDNLVLLFHGTLLAIPNSVLPAQPKVIVEQINDWAKQRPKLDAANDA